MIPDDATIEEKQAYIQEGGWYRAEDTNHWKHDQFEGEWELEEAVILNRNRHEHLGQES